MLTRASFEDRTTLETTIYYYQIVFANVLVYCKYIVTEILEYEIERVFYGQDQDNSAGDEICNTESQSNAEFVGFVVGSST